MPEEASADQSVAPDSEGPGAEQERTQSQTAYTDSASSEAQAVMEQKFAEELSGMEGSPARELEPDMYEDFLAPNMARVDPPGEGGTRLLVSSFPLRDEAEGGAVEPIDLDLRRDGDHYEAQNPLVEVALPADLADPIRLASGEVRIHLSKDAGATTPKATVEDDQKLFFHEAAPDTDLVLTAAEPGAELLAQLRSPQAPERLSFDVAVPAGAELRDLGERGIGVVRGEERLASISAPRAVDAQGTPVETHLERTQGGFDLVVDHSSADLAYPVLVDPMLTEDWLYNNWTWGTNQAGMDYWNLYGSSPFVASRSCLNGVNCWYSGNGLYLYAIGGWWAWGGSWAEWSYDTPGSTTYIPEAHFYPVYRELNGDTCCATPHIYEGLYEDGVDWGGYHFPGGPGTPAEDDPLVHAGGSYWGYWDVFYSYPDASPNRAVFGLYTSPPGRTPATTRTAMLGGAYIYLEDPEAPTVSAPVHVQSLATWYGNATLNLQASAYDPGLGVQQFKIYVLDPQAPDGLREIANQGLGCGGAHSTTICQANPQNVPVSYSTSTIPEGRQKVYLTAVDPQGAPEYESYPPQEWEVRVDRSGPQIDLSGSLATAANGDLAGDSYDLHVAATDGTTDPDDVPEAHRSGIKSIRVYVDDHAQEVASPDQACPQDSCPMEFDYTLDTTQLGASSSHTVTVIATDQLGNATTKTLTVTTYPGAILSPEAGDTTARRFSLIAQRHTASYNQVTFEFRRSDTGTWTAVPTSSLTKGGQPVAWPVALGPDGKNPELSWDVPSTPGIDGVDGPIQLRADFLADGAHQAYSQTVTTTLDRDTTTSKHASAPVGPGTVDLLTGNFTVTADDVSVDSWGSDLTVSRSFNSRQPGQNPNGPFGPGWIASNPVDAAGSDYTTLSLQDQIAKVNESDGTTITFSKNGAGDFMPEPGYEDLALAISGQDYTLSDLDGNVTTFAQQPGGGPDFRPIAVKQPGQAVSTSYNWETVGGATRITRQIAPVPAGVSCSASGSLNQGCRALDFSYATSTTATGTFSTQWGDFAGRLREVVFNSGSGQTAVARYQYDSNGRLRAAWDPRISPALKTTYSYNWVDNRLSAVATPGEPAWNLSYEGGSATDLNQGRLHSAYRSTPNGEASTRVAYGIPLTGSGTPYQMGSDDVSEWGQTDAPTDAAAVFPADITLSDPPSSSQLEKATVYYMNRNGDAVNVANPGGEISTVEYEEHRQVRRMLTPGNRARALADSNPAQMAAKLDTQSVYGADGLELREQFGPMHPVTLADGTEVDAREHSVTAYDQGAPAIQHPHLPTTTAVGARIEGASSDVEVRTTTTSYKWKLRQPTGTTVDPGSGTHLNLTSKTTYDNATGLPIESRSPKANAEGTDAHTTKAIYYTAAANPGDSACGNKPEWANLPCKTMPAGQPGGSAPNLPVTSYQYNTWNQPTVVTDTVPGSGQQRTATTTYDAAGRTISNSASATGGNVGTALPTVTNAYSPTTGRLATTTAGGQTISRFYDSIGRMTGYTDAEGRFSSITYDILDRPVVRADGPDIQPVGSSTHKASSTYSYDPTTRRLSAITDSEVGQMTASYDADGNVVAETLPAGPIQINVTMSYDAAGNPTQKGYWTCPQPACLVPNSLYSDTAHYSVHNQLVAEQTTTNTIYSDPQHTPTTTRSATYSYDAAGRLTSGPSTRAGQCTIHRYAYDQASNRTDFATVAPLPDGSCNNAGQGQLSHHTYDAADRLMDSGYAYDPFGRTLTVPASDAGGASLSAGYYVDDRVRTLTQAGVTQTFNLDPLERVRLQSTTGKPDQVFHYSDDSDNPSWISMDDEEASWVRFISDPAGELSATQVGHGTTSDDFSYQLTNLHGDVVATASRWGGTVLKNFDYDEFGVPSGEIPSNGHGWLGGKERRTQFPTGVIAMGARVYVPRIGRFLQTDPVAGGSANDYDYANQDPVNQLDIDGTRARRNRRARPARRGPQCDVHVLRPHQGGVGASGPSDFIFAGKATINNCPNRRVTVFTAFKVKGTRKWTSLAGGPYELGKGFHEKVLAFAQPVSLADYGCRPGQTIVIATSIRITHSGVDNLLKPVRIGRARRRVSC